GVADLIVLGMVKEVHERDEAAMAPADDADAARINVVVGLQHPLPGGEDVLDLQAAVVDELPQLLGVAAAAAVFRSDDGVALIDQLAEEIDEAGVEVAVHAAVNEDDERSLAAREPLLRDEGISVEDDRVAGPLRGRVLDDPRRRPRVPDLVHLRAIL